MKKTAKPIKANHAVAKDVSRAGSAAVRSPRNASKGTGRFPRSRARQRPRAPVRAHAAARFDGLDGFLDLSNDSDRKRALCSWAQGRGRRLVVGMCARHRQK
eukprot:scaffold570_cov234-Pinguiococcus_pyrenoidosus.AAC.4